MRHLAIKFLVLSVIILKCSCTVYGQGVPAEEEKIPYLVTFGKYAETKWGDDDHCQIFFFVIPISHVDPIYIRVFDPDTGGEIDEENAGFDTQTRFRIYGGKGAYSKDEKENKDPVGDYTAGTLLADQTISFTSDYDKIFFTRNN